MERKDPPLTPRPPSPPINRKAVFLVGFMGAGKTSVGRLLAQRHGWRFVDLDDQIVARTGKSVADIFREHGEEHFRSLETEALRLLLNALFDGDPTVVALGGGAFVQRSNQDLLSQAGVRVVFLDAPLDELQNRLGQSDPTRPLTADFEHFRHLYDERQPEYRRAPHRVQTAGKDVVEVVRELESLLGEH